MRLELTGRHVDISPALRRLVAVKLSKLERLLNDRAVSAQAELSREKHGVRADITLHARGEKFLHGEGNNDSWEASIGEAIAKLSQQAQRIKGKDKARKRGAVRTAVSAAAPVPAAAARPATERKTARPRMPPILRTTRRTIKPMSVADAARAVDASDGVVIFRDVETDAVSVLYRQRNGELGLVETEA